MVAQASAYGQIHRFLFRLSHVIFLEGLRVGVFRFAIENLHEVGSQGKSRVEYFMGVCLSWKQTSIDGNKRAPLVAPRNLTASPI